MTLKWTCDHQGNWRQVPIVLDRVGIRWIERTTKKEGRVAA